jgi:5'-methylthioadenosine phosphorylase
MEGPLFSTRGESVTYKAWKAQLIGMTALPEAKLAREAEICYALIAMVTDYDCWHESEEAVTMDMVLKVMKGNTQAVQKMFPELIAALAGHKECECNSAARFALAHPLRDETKARALLR